MTEEQSRQIEEATAQALPVIQRLFPAATLTKLELFSAMAMQGLLANPNYIMPSLDDTNESIQKRASEIVAGAMLHASFLMAEVKGRARVLESMLAAAEEE